MCLGIQREELSFLSSCGLGLGFLALSDTGIMSLNQFPPGSLELTQMKCGIQWWFWRGWASRGRGLKLAGGYHREMQTRWGECNRREGRFMGQLDITLLCSISPSKYTALSSPRSLAPEACGGSLMPKMSGCRRAWDWFSDLRVVGQVSLNFPWQYVDPDCTKQSTRDRGSGNRNPVESRVVWEEA